MQEVIIGVNKQFSGYTFGLSSLQRKALIDEFGSTPSPNLFISYTPKEGLVPYQDAIKEHIVPFLLGMKKEQLKGLIVKLINIQTEEELLTIKDE